ncbi:MAG: phospho-N-acetylmuramoyl-pentapeptide-transferase [Clostridia bacterium]|nr:phospho-N-acetylmuramoyl-pentapeptide-transferase [Clostridia bacterium]
MKIYFIAALAAFGIALLLTALLTPLLKRLKAGQYILGYVKEHKSKSGTPTMGGLAFISAVIIAAIIFYGFQDKTINLTLITVSGFMLVGFLDDFLKIYRKENEGLKPYQKIIFQFSIAVIAAVYCYVNKITRLNLPFGGGFSFDISWGIIPLVLFVYLSSVNCVNLTDGLDGLAGGTSCAYLAVMGIILAASGSTVSMLCFMGAGAVAAFLLFNVNKACVFMGDTGSLALGGLIACVTVFSGNTLYLPIIGITFVLSGISVIVQVIYYKRTGRRVFLMAPLHHHFQMKGYTECKISYAYALITAVIGMICIIFM